MKSAEDGVRFDDLQSAERRERSAHPCLTTDAFSLRCNNERSIADPTQMPLAKDDEMVDALAADRPDQPFGKGVLPGRRRGNRLVSYAHGA